MYMAREVVIGVTSQGRTIEEVLKSFGNLF